MDPELNRYILLNEGKGLVPGYPQSTLDILGKSNIAAMALFIAFKQIMETESSSSYEAFKAEFDKLMMGSLSLPINIPGTNYYGGFMVYYQRCYLILLPFLFDDRGFWGSPDRCIIGLGGLQASTPRPKTYPIYMGGLVLARGGWAQGRKRVLRILREIIEKRRDSLMKHDDILDYLLKDEDSKYKLNDDEILDQVIMILYSGFETISTTSMMAIKYLHDHPTALQELRDEHFAIRGRKKPEEPIEWNDYKTMSFYACCKQIDKLCSIPPSKNGYLKPSILMQVTFETLRLATVVNGVLRKTTEEMELNGFVIPRGWRIYVYTREINYNPFLYPEPLKFNPWRWLDKSMESQNYCFLFGGGSRLCPGKELGIVIISTFLHYFVTQYRWEEVGGEKILKFPRVEAPNGLHVRVSKYQD
ncbi:brassinosteroid-6-oxidase 2 [Actinidia rufa]|uniref:Brassinosteroid-6-oxidase 2 n=1 Tax=Actinidia rufa TaxID=165716 RepID=A0A7J0EQI3_9ERIC|nr:brassinosteroid-6-oxidase 2 [Actinidia rufa]